MPALRVQIIITDPPGGGSDSCPSEDNFKGEELSELSSRMKRVRKRRTRQELKAAKAKEARDEKERRAEQERMLQERRAKEGTTAVFGRTTMLKDLCTSNVCTVPDSTC